MLYMLLVAGAIACAIQAVRAKRLFLSALWLAGLSALTAVILYAVGAREVAVIELSVGAGLVTVLFVFAIGVAGEEALHARAIVPKPLAGALIIASSALLGWMFLPSLNGEAPSAESTFASALWQERGLDVLVQIVLIFAGVLCVLGLLAEARAPAENRAMAKAPLTPAEAGAAPSPSPVRATPEEVHA